MNASEHFVKQANRPLGYVTSSSSLSKRIASEGETKGILPDQKELKIYPGRVISSATSELISFAGELNSHTRPTMLMPQRTLNIMQPASLCGALVSPYKQRISPPLLSNYPIQNLLNVEYSIKIKIVFGEIVTSLKWSPVSYKPLESQNSVTG